MTAGGSAPAPDPLAPDPLVADPLAPDPLALLAGSDAELLFLKGRQPAARLAGRARGLRDGLVEAGVGPGRPVALLLPDSPGLVAASLAALAAGARPQLLDPTADAGRQAAALAEDGAGVLVTYDLQRLIDRSLLLAAERPGLRVGLLRSSEELPFPRNLLAPLLRASGIGQRPAHEAFFRLAPPRRPVDHSVPEPERQLLFSDGAADLAALAAAGGDGTAPLHTRAGFAALLGCLAAGGTFRVAAGRRTDPSASSA